jgi:hypothetical protein
MKETTRTFTQTLLMEILFQLVNNEHSSTDYVRERLKRAGLTQQEIDALTE